MKQVFSIGDERSSSNYSYLDCDECHADSEKDCKCSSANTPTINSSIKSSKEYGHAVIDTNGLLVAEILKEVKKLSREIEDLKFMIGKCIN